MRCHCDFGPKLKAGLALAVLLSVCGSSLGVGTYQQTNLVSDQSGVAAHTDGNLVNPWGVVFNPAGFSWVANNGTGTSTLYDGSGNPQSLVVSIPSQSAGAGGTPTGIVYSSGSQFQVNGSPAIFMFAGEDGVISGWAPSTGTQAIREVDQSAAGAVYKGLGLTGGATPRLYAADFHNGRIDQFDGSFAPVAGGFVDPNLPAGYAPFNVRNLGGKVYVSYAVQDAMGRDDVPGLGNGIVDVYDTAGVLQNRLITGGDLNSPWGMAIAPANFGALSGDLLVGNFGDGLIHGYDPTTGTEVGVLTDSMGNPIQISGLWGIEFGNGVQNQPTNTLFFAAGPEDESHGLYGRIDAVPAPAGGLLLGVAMGAAGSRRRRNRR